MYGYKTDEYVQGIYSINLQGEMRYFDFGKLRHFYEYRSSPAAALRMKSRALRNEAKGKAPIKQNRITLDKIQPHPQGYALVGVLYKSMYKTETQEEKSGFLLAQTTRTTKHKIIHKYQHAIACVFDYNGNLLWDNSYKLTNNSRSNFGLGVKTAITPEGNIIMTYIKDSEIFYKIVQPTSSSSNKVILQLHNTAEKRVISSQEDIQHWYGCNFIAFGFQRINSKTGPSRTVFYLQQVAFE
ncbi:hypothetical protein GCM10023183_34630 [Nibribacter koreensis]|uniref:Uncharacterized protein n=2 Tax=Nibribacter koreensis TaxID=1084519 RepID=A0ABP8FZY0_9BACT